MNTDKFHLFWGEPKSHYQGEVIPSFGGHPLWFGGDPGESNEKSWDFTIWIWIPMKIPFLVGWTSIYQLFWCEQKGTRFWHTAISPREKWFWEEFIWLVIWNMNFIFPIMLGISSSQLTNSYVSEGQVYQPVMGWWISIWSYVISVDINHTSINSAV